MLLCCIRSKILAAPKTAITGITTIVLVMVRDKRGNTKRTETVKAGRIMALMISAS